MTMVANIKTAAEHEFHWMRWGLRIIIAALLFVGVGDDIDSSLWPVLRIDSVTNVRLTDDYRLCFVINGAKLRPATGLFYVAQVYEGEDPHPQIRGLEHFDRTPYGGSLSGAPPQAIHSDTCVHVTEGAYKAPRLGLRLFARYDVPNRPWQLNQPPIWVDYYPQRSAPSPGG